MKMTGFDGTLFSSLGLTASTDPLGSGPSRSPVLNTRLDSSPAYAGVIQGEQTLTIKFVVKKDNTVETTLQRLLSVLQPGNDVLRELTGQLVDGTEIYCMAAALSWRYENVNVISVEFVVPSGEWLFLTSVDTESMAAITATDDLVYIAVYNDGYKTVYPEVRIYWDGATDPSETSNQGWKYRKKIDIHNGTLTTIENFPIQLGPWDTETLVAASKMRSDCNDVRIYRNGRQIRRDVINPNSLGSFIWFVPDPIPAGDTHTYEVVYGNSFAFFSTTGGESNGTYTLVWSTVAFGGFNAEPPIPVFDTEGAAFNATSATSTTVTNSGASWETDEWAQAALLNMTTGAYRRIVSNTGTVLTVDRAFITNPLTTDDLIIIKSGYKATGGRASSGSASTLTDSSQSWITNEWYGATIETTAGTGSGQTRTVSGSSGSQVSVTSNWSVTPDATTQYRIYKRNAVWNYDMRETTGRNGLHRGLWLANDWNRRPSQVRFDAPGSWYRQVYKRNTDAFSQLRARKNTTSGDWHQPMYIRRAREGKNGTQEEVGIADSVALFVPVPIVSLKASIDYRSATQAADPTLGMCKFVIGVQDSGGEDWDHFYEYGADENSTITLPDTDHAILSSDTNFYNRIMMALIPNETDKIDDNDNNTAQVYSNGPTWSLTIDSSDIDVDDIATASEEHIYDLYGTLAIEPEADSFDSYTLYFGDPERKIFLPEDYHLLVNCEDRVAQVVETADGDILETVTARIFPTYYDSAMDQEFVSPEWLPIAANDQLIINPTFETDLSGWVLAANTAVTAVTAQRSTATDFDGHSFQFIITSSGAWEYAYESEDFIPVNPDKVYVLQGWTRKSTTANLGTIIYVDFYDENDVYISSADAPNVASSGSFREQIDTFVSVPAGATQAKVKLYMSGGAAVAGVNAFFDRLYFGQGKSLLEYTGLGTDGSLSIDLQYTEGGMF